MARNHLSQRERDAYPVRFGACLALSLLVLIAAFRFWPRDRGELDDGIFDTRGQELIQVEEILPTRQNRRRPPPPAPLTPVIVPDDVVLEEVILELPDDLLTADPGDEEGEEDEGNDTATSGAPQPDSGPRAFRVVEPEYSREAQRRRVAAEVVVEVLVNPRGRVETAKVVNRYLLEGRDKDQRESVDTIGYGIEEAALAAAREWMFRPARENGRTVSSLTRLTFSFGI